MKLDIPTLAFILSLTLVTQVIALLVQYRVNRTYRGIGLWLLGSTFMALGVTFMLFLEVTSLEMLVRIANPLVILGQIFLYIGIVRFLDIKENRIILISIFAIFALSYFYYMYVNNDISGRTIVVSATLAVISLMTAYKLFLEKDRLIFGSANFTAAIFLSYGCFLTWRAFLTLILPSLNSYIDLGQASIHIFAYIVPLIASTLWTSGFIIMVNQRLNAENLEEKEKFQQIFNTSPDAAMITQLNDGLVMDVNGGFLLMSGYTRAEVIGNSTINNNVWHNAVDRQIFTTKLNINGICENMEFTFHRKDGSQLVGMISARIIAINDLPHIISVIRDITKRKEAEKQIQNLVQQLEIEKNTAHLNSITDSLTGLSNRRYFDEALRTEFHKLKQSEATLSLIMLDVDYFKKFNDSYGHLAGDDCLSKIGITLKSIVEGTPYTAARYGGEEFIVILPETETKEAQALAQIIRKSVEMLSIPHSESQISEYVTVSLGVTTVYPTELASMEQVVALADKAMYCAKECGRNRIEVTVDNTTQVKQILT